MLNLHGVRRFRSGDRAWWKQCFWISTTGRPAKTLLTNRGIYFIFFFVFIRKSRTRLPRPRSSVPFCSRVCGHISERTTKRSQKSRAVYTSHGAAVRCTIIFRAFTLRKTWRYRSNAARRWYVADVIFGISPRFSGGWKKMYRRKTKGKSYKDVFNKKKKQIKKKPLLSYTCVYTSCYYYYALLRVRKINISGTRLIIFISIWKHTDHRRDIVSGENIHYTVVDCIRRLLRRRSIIVLDGSRRCPRGLKKNGSW